MMMMMMMMIIIIIIIIIVHLRAGLKGHMPFIKPAQIF